MVIRQVLYYETYVKPECEEWVVFLHGAGGSSKTWNYQLEVFKSHYNLLLLDLRDHGASKNLVPQYDHYHFEIISNDIVEVLDFLQIVKAHFITLSFGSVLLQDFSQRFPDRINKVVLGGGIFKGNLAIKSFVFLARILNQLFSYSTMYGLFSYLLMPRKRNQFARRLYQRQAQKLTQSEYMKWVGLYGEFFKLLKQFYNQVISWPTMIVMGADDYIFLQSARKFYQKQQSASLHIIPKAGHICNIEKPKEFNDVVLNFLRQ